MPSSKTTFPLRLKPENKERIALLAEKESRPISMQIELIIEQYIADYERQHGPLKGEK